MALSETVLTSMRDAESHLRNALSFASRTERPNTVSHIARLIADIDNIICADEMIDKIEHREFGSSGTFGTFFETDE
tara:strand:+ start:707 stop:937 length:231 start_codon:yes stop_codon:yes gene_type:complete